MRTWLTLLAVAVLATTAFGGNLIAEGAFDRSLTIKDSGIVSDFQTNAWCAARQQRLGAGMDD